MNRPFGETVIRRLRAYGLVPEVPVRLVRLGRTRGTPGGSKVLWRAEDAAGVPLGVASVHTVEEMARARAWTWVSSSGVTLIAPDG